MLLSLLVLACEPEKECDDSWIRNAILDQRVVTVVEKEVIVDNGIVAGRYTGTFHYTGVMDYNATLAERVQADKGIVQIKNPLTTGCFGVPECTRLDGTKGRAIVRVVDDDFTIYWEDESDAWPGDIGGVTYCLEGPYSPVDDVSSDRNQLRNRIQNQIDRWAGHPSYHGKRLGWCQEKNPHLCHQDEGGADGGV
jgi:hypothetical protein